MSKVQRKCLVEGCNDFGQYKGYQGTSATKYYSNYCYGHDRASDRPAPKIEAEKELDDELRGLVRSAVWFWEPKADHNLYGHPGFEELIKEFHALVDKAVVAELEKLSLKQPDPETDKRYREGFMQMRSKVKFRLSQLGAKDEQR